MNVPVLRRVRQWLAAFLLLRSFSPASVFRSDTYLRHNQRRLEHLASLGLALCGRSVLEVGAGIGDHTSFFLDRECVVTVTDARLANVRQLRRTLPDSEVALLDLDGPAGFDGRLFEIVYCYGTLYHLRNPAVALRYLAERCNGQLLLETCVSKGLNDAVNLTPENQWVPSQAVSGIGCRPTRSWVFRTLSELFPYVYATTTQPAHPEFPLDWSQDVEDELLTRAVFVASRVPLQQRSLTPSLPEHQVRCEPLLDPGR